MTNIRTIDFDIRKEPWNQYEIHDGSILKIRTILMKVERVAINNKEFKFNMETQTLPVIHAANDLKGSPNPKPVLNSEITKAIEVPNMRYNTKSQEFNEYYLDDGTTIKIYTNVTDISRSRLKNRSGDPIYSITTSNQVDIRPSTQYGGMARA